MSFPSSQRSAGVDGSRRQRELATRYRNDASTHGGVLTLSAGIAQLSTARQMSRTSFGELTGRSTGPRPRGRNRREVAAAAEMSVA